MFDGVWSHEVVGVHEGHRSHAESDQVISGQPSAADIVSIFGELRELIGAAFAPWRQLPVRALVDDWREIAAFLAV